MHKSGAAGDLRILDETHSTEIGVYFCLSESYQPLKAQFRGLQTKTLVFCVFKTLELVVCLKQECAALLEIH